MHKRSKGNHSDWEPSRRKEQSTATLHQCQPCPESRPKGLASWFIFTVLQGSACGNRVTGIPERQEEALACSSLPQKRLKIDLEASVIKLHDS